MKDFIMVESDEPLNAHITGIINGRTVHIHLNGERVHYYEKTEEWFDLSLRITPGFQSSTSTAKEES